MLSLEQYSFLGHPSSIAQLFTRIENLRHEPLPITSSRLGSVGDYAEVPRIGGEMSCPTQGCIIHTLHLLRYNPRRCILRNFPLFLTIAVHWPLILSGQSRQIDPQSVLPRRTGFPVASCNKKIYSVSFYVGLSGYHLPHSRPKIVGFIPKLFPFIIPLSESSTTACDTAESFRCISSK